MDVLNQDLQLIATLIATIDSPINVLFKACLRDSLFVTYLEYQ